MSSKRKGGFMKIKEENGMKFFGGENGEWFAQYVEENGLWYKLREDYYLPCLTVAQKEKRPVGIWGQRHAAFLKKYQRCVYDEFFFSGKLNAYLTQIDRNAQEMFDLLVRQLAAHEGITETRKAKNQMEWVRQMDSIRNRAKEIVDHDLILI